MEYKLIIVLILLVTIYALYYTKKNFNLIIALSLLLIFVLNGVINDKELFTSNMNILGMNSLFEKIFNQNNNIDNLEDNLDLLETVIEEKLIEQEEVNYPMIQICSSEPLSNSVLNTSYNNNNINQTRTNRVLNQQNQTTNSVSNTENSFIDTQNQTPTTSSKNKCYCFSCDGNNKKDGPGNKLNICNNPNSECAFNKTQSFDGFYGCFNSNNSTASSTPGCNTNEYCECDSNTCKPLQKKATKPTLSYAQRERQVISEYEL